MHHHIRACALLLALALPSARVVAAEAGKGITGPEMVAILQDLGYKAALDKDGEGDPMIRTKMGGFNTYVYFYDCDAGTCGSLQLSIGLDLEQGTNAEVLNRFSRDNRYAHVYLDDEKDPFMQFDFEVLHASHAEHIASQVDLWEKLIDRFARATGYRDNEPTDAGESSQTTGTVRRM